MKRAYALITLDRAQAALPELDVALVAFRREGERVWEARCLLNRAWANGDLRRLRQADRDARAAHELLTALGQQYEAAIAIQNRAAVAADYGDLPNALQLIDAAQRGYQAAGEAAPPELVALGERVLFAARLFPEAWAAAAAGLSARNLTAMHRARLMIRAAASGLVVGEREQALAMARAARRAFRAADRPSWVAVADLVLAGADVDSGRASPRLLARLAAISEQLDADHGADAPLAHLLAARVAGRLGRAELVRRHLRAAQAGRHGSPLHRSVGWLATAELAQAAGDRAAVLRACRSGLRELDVFRQSLGDTQLRALASEHGREVSALGLRTVLAHGSARDLLAWSERIRASALATAPALPPDDVELADALGAVRRAARDLAETEADQPQALRARRDRDRFEAEVRRRYRELHGTSGGPGPFDVRALARAVGGDTLISLVDVDGTLFGLRVHAGRVTRHTIGPSAAALHESEFARFALRRAAYGRVPDLGPLASALQATVLGPLADRLTERVVIVPPASLHTLPWGLLPVLADRDITLAPSARQWLAAGGRDRRGPVVFVSGPQLSSDQAEVTRQAGRYAGARVLTGEHASAAAAAGALDGAGLAHLAAHGDFRADAPMFSSLQLSDGPLYLYDLDRLASPPHTVVLSACDVGGSCAVGVDEGLGMVTGLLGLGTSAVLASTVPVNDHATMTVMDHLHAALAGGATLSGALSQARRNSREDPLAAATAAAFTAWGA